MKKLFKNAIFSVIFALCCVFAFFCTNSLSLKVNATENENQTQEEVVEDDNKTEENEEQEQESTVINEELNEFLEEFKAYIIAFVVAFLGSGGFTALFKVIVDRWVKKKDEELKLKVEKLEEEKKINAEQKELVLKQFDELKKKFNEVLEYNVILCDFIKTKIEVDEKKVEQTNKLLESLLPEVDENETNGDVANEEQK